MSAADFNTWYDENNQLFYDLEPARDAFDFDAVNETLTNIRTKRMLKQYEGRGGKYWLIRGPGFCRKW